MRIIQKEISLEPMTSRLPSVWPSIYNSKLYYFDDKTLIDREWQYTSNWGMIPLKIRINHNPNETDESGRPHDSDNWYAVDKDGGFILSFENLSKWYNFFNEYYNLLRKNSHCSYVYTSAEDYYNHEVTTRYANEMIYGTEVESYIDLDKEFAEMGGKVEVEIFDKKTSQYSSVTPSEAHECVKDSGCTIIDVYDIGFFKWICDNVVPTFMIPMKYRDYWKRTALFYPDVIKWIAWFKNRKGYEYVFTQGENGEIDTWDCKNEGIDNCCDCEEYFNRGGERMCSAMTEWYNNIQTSISLCVEKISANTKSFIPYMISPIELQVSIDDLGENTIFSKEYELGIDYRVASGETATENTNSGTVVTMDGQSIILNSGSGYTYDQTYMEKYVSQCKNNSCGYKGVFYGVCPKCGSKDVEVIGWGDYTDKYIKEHENEFNVSSVTYFAYDYENVKYTSDKNNESEAKADLEDQMSKKYPLTIRDNGWILINSILYPIDESEYGEYDSSNKYLSGRTYLVSRESGTNTPYTFINGKQVYGDLYTPKNKFYFPFFKNKDSNADENCSGKTFNINDYKLFDRIRDKYSEVKSFIEFNGVAYEINSDSGITIDDEEYYKINGYTIDDVGDLLYWRYDDKILNGTTLEEIADARIYPDIYNPQCIKIKYPLDIEMYSVKEINGRTLSKLSDLRLYNILTDDIGNDIEGIYQIDGEKYTFQPPEGTELEPLYQVGNVANVSRFAHTVNDLDDIKEGNYFVGNIIKEMKFYYKLYDDDVIPPETVVRVYLDSGDTYQIKMEDDEKLENVSGYTSLSAITNSTTAKKALEEDETHAYMFYDDIFCDITYYIGATLKRKKGENFNLSYDSGFDNHGVEYTETVQFVKENVEYYMKKPTNTNDVLPLERDAVRNHSISYPICIYKMKQTLEEVSESQYESIYEVPMADFRFNINLFDEAGYNTFENNTDMEKRNGLQVYPTLMEEYRLGISTMENIDSDIYIDRGINAAFEKHVKLGEVTSLEALINYGNNFFKIVDS